MTPSRSFAAKYFIGFSGSIHSYTTLFNMPRNVFATFASNCIPLYFVNSDIAYSLPGDGLYGLFAVMESKESATCSILAPRGIVLPLEKGG